MKILSIVGTRPNFMKIAPLIEEFRKHGLRHVLVHTGQHYDARLSRLFFDDLGLPKPDEHLACITGQSVNEQRKSLKLAIKEALKRQRPDLVVVVGDVNSTVAGAEAAHGLGIKVAHIEAGLRSFDNTMPEEINRIRTDRISDFLFTTERSADENLKKEGLGKNKIFFVGNVMIDTLLKHREKAEKSRILSQLKLDKKRYCVLTLHRPSNVDRKGEFVKILEILEKIQEKMKIVFPVHPRTRKNIGKFGLEHRIRAMKNLIITKPLGYLDFLCLMSHSRLVLTDSGGIQEETTVLGVPCITLRNNTERPVTVSQGTNLLVSTSSSKVVEAALQAIEGKASKKRKMPPLWDGMAAQRIVGVLKRAINNPQ